MIEFRDFQVYLNLHHYNMTMNTKFVIYYIDTMSFQSCVHGNITHIKLCQNSSAKLNLISGVCK